MVTRTQYVVIESYSIEKNVISVHEMENQEHRAVPIVK